MKEEIKKGDIIRPIHCERSQYMNKDFLDWIDENLNKTFLVESKINSVIRLKKVYFSITDEFLEKYNRKT